MPTARISAGSSNSVGPYEKENVNDGHRVGGRLSLLVQPSDAFKITPRVVYQKVKAGGFNREDHYIFFNNQFTTGGNTLEEREQYLLFREKFTDKTLLTDLVASYDFGPAEITSVSSYMDRDILVSRDASALTDSVFVSFVDGYDGVDPVRTAALAQYLMTPSNLRDTTKLKQFTQELRLSSTGTGPFQWVVGGFYSDIDRRYEQTLPTAGGEEAQNLILELICFNEAFADATCATNDPIAANRVAYTADQLSNGFAVGSPYNASLPYDIKQHALFGEGSYQLGQFKLTAGARYYKFKETRDFVSGGVFSDVSSNIGDKTKSNGISPRFIVSYEANPNLTFNVQAAKGFRLGGTNDPLNVPLCTDEDLDIFGGQGSYKDETLWNYEAGMKFSRRGLTFNTGVFHSRIRNLQVTQTAGSCSSRIVFNVPKAHSTGIEAELAAQLLPGFDLSLAANLQSAKFDSTVLTGAGDVLGGIEDGNRLPTVPKYQLAATATYGQRLGNNADWYITGSAQRIGNRFGEPGDQVSGAGLIPNALYYDPATGDYGSGVNDIGSLRLPAYTIANLSAGIEFDSGLEIVAYVKNMFDENPELAIDRERGLRARFGYLIGQPRTIGLTIRQAFRAAAAPPAAVYVAPPPPPPAPPATQTCPDGSVILATDMCPAPPPPPPPPAPLPERG